MKKVHRISRIRCHINSAKLLCLENANENRTVLSLKLNLAQKMFDDGKLQTRQAGYSVNPPPDHSILCNTDINMHCYERCLIAVTSWIKKRQRQKIIA
jgi:hypothetical protein